MAERGRGAHLAGLAAEEVAARLYTAEGARVLATRWRCPEGEIDLVVSWPKLIVFVEVKARPTRDAAAAALTPRQWRRLGRAAQRFLAAEPQALQCDCRFDVVLVDGAGRAERIENAHFLED
jgi:putative endonuclease